MENECENDVCEIFVLFDVGMWHILLTVICIHMHLVLMTQDS